MRYRAYSQFDLWCLLVFKGDKNERGERGREKEEDVSSPSHLLTGSGGVTGLSLGRAAILPEETG